MQCLLEAIRCCDTAAGISFNYVIAAEGIEVIPNIHALLYDADQLFICIIHEAILEELMYLISVRLEVGTA